MGADPRTWLRHWLPHLLLLAIGLVALSWLLWIIAPIGRPVLLGTALAMLTTPILFDPIDRLLAAIAPSWTTAYRRYCASFVATMLLLGVSVLVVLLILTALLGPQAHPLRAMLGLAFQDPRAVAKVVDGVASRTGAVLALYPSLGLTPMDVRDALTSFLVHSRFGPEFVRLVFTGTGGLVVEIVLTITTTFYLYSQMPQLVGLLLRRLPLDPEGQAVLRRRFARTVQHLLAETIGKALAIGVALGAVAWAVAGFNPVLVGIVGIFAGLLPVVGHAFIWLPLASLLATQGRWTESWCLAIACWAAAWLIERVSVRLARALGTDDTLLSFLLFLSVIGGVLGEGVRGLVLGPAAMIFVVVLVEYAAQLYAPRESVPPGAAPAPSPAAPPAAPAAPAAPSPPSTPPSPATPSDPS